MNEAGKRTVLITGGTGFVGRQLIQRILERNDYLVRAVIRESNIETLGGCELIPVRDIATHDDWSKALKDCEVVIHMAARVHVMKENALNPLQEFRRVNVEGTLNLARQAARLGVKRFVYISSIKVNGEKTQLGHAYRPEDLPAPEDPYATSKYEAEQGLLALSTKTGMQVVIIRPPLVYGPGVKGNFQRMMNWLQKGYPLPLKTVNNKRSLVSVYNLTDLIIQCMDHPQAANQVFLVSDGDDLSTVELLQKIGEMMNKPVRLVPVPYWMLNSMATIIGKQAFIQRLCGSLQVDISKTCELLEWKPKVSVDETLRRVVRDS
ncbi:UDP-glucose 4-epimerase (Galactowaldenase) (UDP-galactose 4-epimerase) [Legionella lansingensis]|uniref:UDP-glucose 4-epimerase n=1 Tax=Legionella lansingensis TaxID=45067 RepID=A0A0W0VW96_9GAMM|nr:SDR family oxidoreductase [Legionella lansingensis]KTD24341.1 UDP-glucose 4-epimerase [Legionella lansingensis]SNV51736.1 UDP-glucose 4-epimerase (Galactowaldenase) (UDP-galactose 4-epimerase) [Legionella lansingensis]